MAQGFDAALYVAAVAGDQEAVSKIVAAHSLDLVRIGVAMGLPKETAEDVAHGTWVKFFEHLVKVRLDPEKKLRDAGALPFWLRTVMRNAVRDVYRTTRRREELAQRVEFEGDALGDFVYQPDVEERLERDSQKQAMWRAFKTLDEVCRQLLVYRLQDPPMTYGEIARTMERPEGAIGPTLARCIDKLRHAMKRRESE